MTKPAKKPRGGQKKSRNARWQRPGKRGVIEVDVTNETLMEDVGLVGEAVCLPCDDKHLYGSAYGEVIKFNSHDRSVTVEYWDQTIGTWSIARHPADYVREYLINPQKETFRGLSSNTDESLNLDEVYRLPYGRTTLWVLDLFSGTKSVMKALEKVLEGYGWRLMVIHLDIDPKRKPDVQCDIRDWYSKLVVELGFQSGDFDIIWASPECRFFSRCNTKVTKGDLAEAVSLVKAARDIIKHFKPAAWTIENPRGRLREQSIMEDLEHLRLTTTYCFYEIENGLYKPTDFWTNVPGLALEFCSKRNPCPWRKQGRVRHRVTAQRGTSSNGTPGTPLDVAISVPGGLLVVILGSAMSLVTRSRAREAREQRETPHEKPLTGRSRGQQRFLMRSV